MPLPHSEQGITLIELLVTVAIVAVIAALSIPNLSHWFEKGLLTSEMDRLASRLVFLRQQAILEGRSYRLQLESGHFVTYAYDGSEVVRCGAVLSPAAGSWVDLSGTPAAPAGTPNYARSTLIPQPLERVESGCSTGTGLCSYPPYGICFTPSGHAPDAGGVVQYVQEGVSTRRLELSATGFMQRFRRRSSSDTWRSY